MCISAPLLTCRIAWKPLMGGSECWILYININGYNTKLGYDTKQGTGIYFSLVPSDGN